MGFEALSFGCPLLVKPSTSGMVQPQGSEIARAQGLQPIVAEAMLEGQAPRLRFKPEQRSERETGIVSKEPCSGCQLFPQPSKSAQLGVVLQAHHVELLAIHSGALPTNNTHKLLQPILALIDSVNPRPWMKPQGTRRFTSSGFRLLRPRQSIHNRGAPTFALGVRPPYRYGYLWLEAVFP